MHVLTMEPSWIKDVSPGCDLIPDKGDLRKERLSVGHNLRAWSIIVGKSL